MTKGYYSLLDSWSLIVFFPEVQVFSQMTFNNGQTKHFSISLILTYFVLVYKQRIISFQILEMNTNSTRKILSIQKHLKKMYILFRYI